MGLVHDFMQEQFHAGTSDLVQEKDRQFCHVDDMSERDRIRN